METEFTPKFFHDQGLYYPASANYYGYYHTESPCKQDDHHGFFGSDGQDNLYYPASANYYGYYHTGTESPCKQDDHHGFFGSDGQDNLFLGLQTETLPFVYYTPSYEYANSPYNPYNPYIPGAITGTDSPIIGIPQDATNSTYQKTVSSPAYIPAVIQSTYLETLPHSSTAPLLLSTGGANIPTLSSVYSGPTSSEPSLENSIPVPFQSASHQVQIMTRPSGGSMVNTQPSKQFLLHGATTKGSIPQVAQGTYHFSNDRVPSAHSPLKATMPANSGFSNLRPHVSGWATGERFRGRFQLNRGFNGNLREQNRGPRVNRSALQAYKTNADTDNMEGNIIIHADQYNGDNFPVEYPNAKFFIIKSFSEDDVHKSIKYHVWSSTTSGNQKLDFAYQEAQRISLGKPRKCPVFLFFSVNSSGQFCGVAEMIGPVDFDKDMDFWQDDRWTGSFPVKWHIVKDVPNFSFHHIILVNNEYRPVTSSRDSQEVPFLPGMSMLTIFKNSPLNTSIFDDWDYYEQHQKLMHEAKCVLLRRTNVIRGAIDQPPHSDGTHLKSTVSQPTISYWKEKTPESDGKLLNHADKFPPLSDGNQQQNGECDQPSTSDTTADDKPSGLEKQLNARKQPNADPPTQASEANVRLPPEIEGISVKHNNEQIIPGLAAMKLDNIQVAQEDTNNTKSRILKTDPVYPQVVEADVFTVGSMEIKVKNICGSLPGVLTFDLVSDDQTKGVKRSA